MTQRRRDVDRAARMLAWVTVGVPAVGTVVAVGLAVSEGVAVVDLVLLAVMYLVTSLGVEGGFHRLFAHRSFRALPAVTACFAVAGSMAAQGPVLFWVAIHREHHKFTDSDGDPHSPRPRGDGRGAVLRGLWHGHVGWLFRVGRASWHKNVDDLLRDRSIVRCNQHYFTWVLLGLAVPAVIGGLVGHTMGAAVTGLLWGGLVRIFLLDNVTWGVNSLGHTMGNRPHRTRDNSRNVAVLAPLSVGGSWHNNHHALPTLAHNRHRPWQLDITGSVIRLLDAARLASAVRYPTPDRLSKRGARP